jgi:hypothetical protein
MGAYWAWKYRFGYEKPGTVSLEMCTKRRTPDRSAASSVE